MAWQTVVLVSIAALAAAGALIAWAIMEARRKREFLAWAAKEGWSYTDRDAADRPKRYLGFTPFGQGHSRLARNILSKRIDGLDIEVFDYRYVVQTGKNSTTYSYVVATAAMALDGHGLRIQAENLGHKILDTLGGEDIDVEDDAFSRKFWVQCRDRRFAYDVLHAPMIDHLMGFGAGWTWQWRGHTLMLHRTGRLNPGTVRLAVAAITGFSQALPRHRLHEVKRAR